MERYAVDFGTSNTVVARWNFAREEPQTMSFPAITALCAAAGLDPADSFAWDSARAPYPGLAPFEAADEMARRQVLAPLPRTGAQPKAPEQTVVMVADDSKVVRVKTSRLLNAYRYQVLLAEDGLDAARQIEQSIPDLLVTDVDMPGLGGLELVRQLRSDPRTASLPIIMVSAKDTEVDKVVGPGNAYVA